MPGAIAADWGPRIWYIEVGDDQQAVRFVEKFNDGKCLRYDRDHWCDDYGMLLGLRFSLKQKWKKFLPEATRIGKAEFEAQWDAAERLAVMGTPSCDIARREMGHPFKSEV